MTQKIKKLEVLESIHCNNIITTSIDSLYQNTGISKCKELYCDFLNSGNITCSNINIQGTVTGPNIGGGSVQKTSYNISNSVQFLDINSIEYDLYTSSRIQDLSLNIEPLFTSIINDNNQLKNFYIYIENLNDTLTNNLDIYLNLITLQNNNIFYENFQVIQGQGIQIKKILSNFTNIPTYLIPANTSKILEIIPFIYPKYTYTSDFEFIGNSIKLFIKEY